MFRCLDVFSRVSVPDHHPTHAFIDLVIADAAERPKY